MRIAVIGSGIAGTAAAWLLSAGNSVDVYEAESRLGGHTNTLDLDVGGVPVVADSGFMVFNRRTYPNLIRFFEQLEVPAHDADMSFSVRVEAEDIEWAGDSLNSVFAQRKNIVNPRFLRMLTDVLRFSRDADRLMADPATADLTLGELLAREGYSESFSDWYLIPMGDAIWSTPPGDMFDYPALTFLRFCDNHGLLHILGKPQWLSVKGGARTYLDAAYRTLSGELHLGEPALKIERTATGVSVTTERRTQHYDAVVLACHPPASRAMLAGTMSPLEREILGAFEFWDNDIVLHTDTSFLPHSERAWASWNWYADEADITKAMLTLTYQLNTLQDLPAEAPVVMETLNRTREPAPGTLLANFSMEHPSFTAQAIAAQKRLGEIQGIDRIYYAGAWTRYGFHEDGLLSAVRVAEQLGAVLPWGDQLDASRTRVLRGAPIPLLGQTRELLPTEKPLYATEEALA